MGWVVVESRSNILMAHYAGKGRNLWAYLVLGGDDYGLSVGEPGALGASLQASCHVALYGVLFDFNKSTLQPTSDGVLQQVATLLAAKPSRKLEVQGHTDNVGDAAYNQTLSDDRARSVVAWLVKHGAAAARLTAKGYGKTRPVADNANEDGRAKNRRVEIADPDCTPSAK